MRVVHQAAFALAVLLSGCGGLGGSLLLGDSSYDDYYGADLIAYDDEYATVQNLPLSVGAYDGLLANDIICCEYELKFPETTASGGSLSILKDGSFVYSPPRNFWGTDFFEYTLKDSYGESKAQVTIYVDPLPDQNFVVDNSRGSDSTGSGVSGDPYATIQAAVDAAGSNATIVVRPGTGAPYSGDISLLPGQTLVGEGFLGSAQGSSRPVITGSIALSDGCTLQGLRLEGGAIDGVLRFDGRISRCEVVGASPIAVDLDGAEGEWTIERCLIENGVTGISVTLLGMEELRLRLDSNTVRANSGPGILLTAADSARLTVGVLRNVLQNNLASRSLDAQARDTAAIGLDLSGNQNTGTYSLSRDGAIFQVEEAGRLAELNTGNFSIPLDPLQSVDDRTFGF